MIISANLPLPVFLQSINSRDLALLCNFKNELGIDEITFHKNTPLTTDRSKVVSLSKRGARLSTHKEKFDGFLNIGLKPEFSTARGFSVTLAK